jgi:hypothetical protein
MDREDLIAQLITELQDLRIRVVQLETAAHERVNESSALETAARERVNESSARRAATPPFRPGDRVSIKKILKKPAIWDNAIAWNQEQAQLATVTHLHRGQVWFETDNGIKTWRAVNNITRLEE